MISQGSLTRGTLVLVQKLEDRLKNNFNLKDVAWTDSFSTTTQKLAFSLAERALALTNERFGISYMCLDLLF